MDHCLLPHHPISPRPRVPLFCNPHESANINFSDYPECIGQHDYQKILRMPHQSQPSESGDSLLQEPIERVLQSWLYFSVIRSILEPHGLFDVDEYLSGEHFISSKTLPRRLLDWAEMSRQLDDQCKIEILANTRQYRSKLQDAITTDHHYDKTLRLSLALLQELIDGAVESIETEGNRTTFTLPFELDAEDANKMLMHGWCPAQVASIDGYHFPSERLYMLNLRQNSLSTDLHSSDHAGCSPRGCALTQIDLETYTPQHALDPCACRYIGPNLNAVKDCLDQGLFPVLDILEEVPGHLSVDVIPWTQGMAYVAISHVWAHGLGNPTAIELPQCQVRNLRDLIQRIEGRSFKKWADEKQEKEITVWENRKLYLWCDSLCCPIASSTLKDGPAAGQYSASDRFPTQNGARRDYKQLALTHMRAVYREAAYVLVLDDSLRSCKFARMDAVEAAARILTCQWMHRLWTLQEAGFAARLLFRFEDEIVDFREIWGSIWGRKDTGLADRYLIRRMGAFCANLRIWHRVGDFNSHDAEASLALGGLRHRKVSVDTDEALCVAAIMQLDNDSIAMTEPNMRMQMMWRLMAESVRGLPQSIVFNEYPRLEAPGFRWAPRTLLVSDPWLDLSFGLHLDVKGLISKQGLKVTLRGWRIRKSAPPLFIHQGMAPESTHPGIMQHAFTVRDENNCWYQVMDRRAIYRTRDQMSQSVEPSDEKLLSTRELLADPNKDLYIIFDVTRQHKQDMTHGWTTKALLAYREMTEPGIYALRSACIVKVHPFSSPWQELHRLGMLYRPILHRAWFVKCLQSLSICERVLSSIINCMPAIALHPHVLAIRTFLRHCRMKLEKAWYSTLLKVVAHARQSQAVVNLWLSLGNTVEDLVGISLWIKIAFMGHYSDVIEEFPETQEWFID